MLLEYIPIGKQDANILAKALARREFEFHRDKTKVVDNPFLVEREC